MSEIYELEDVLEEMIQSRIAEISVSFPGVIQAVSEDGRFVDVVPQVQRPVQNEDGSWTSEEICVLSQIPVAQISMGGYRFTIPAVVGAKVDVRIADFDISTFLSTGSGGASQRFHVHNLSDAIAYPRTAQPGQAASTTDLEIGHVDCLIKANSQRVAIGGESDSGVADSLLQGELANIAATLITGVADLGTGAVTFTSPYTPGNTASNKLKLGG